MENPCKELWYKTRIEELEEGLKEARLQELASLGQAQEAYEAQVELEVKLNKAIAALKFYGWEDDDQGAYACRVLKDLGYKYSGDK
jgi:hypothetical protein